jgi:hypothetical protein
VNRVEARRFAEARVVDASVLLDAGRWQAAYYLIGYAVECALKSCVLAYVEESGIIFQDKKFAEKCFTHDIEALVSAANLVAIRGQDIAANPAFGLNWQLLKDWGVGVRYLDKSEDEARALFEAVTTHPNGLLSWIKERW